MKLSLFFLFVAISFALPSKSLEKKNQELSRTNGVLLQALRELTTSNEGQAEKALADPWGSYSGPSKDCYSFNKNCNGCRGYLSSCCSDKNCAGGRKCKAGIWSYSCDNTAEEAVSDWDSEDVIDFDSEGHSGAFDFDSEDHSGWDSAEKQVAGGCYTTSGNCKSGYYKLSGGLKCCPRLSEKAVGFFGKYKCLKRNNCIAECQEGDSSKTWYACMKECPKSLCDKDDESESMDPEDEEDDDSEEEAVGLTCEKDGFKGTVTTDSWCDKRDYVWMHKCSDCRHGYYWYWWHTYCCTPGKSGCTCAYN